MSDRGLRDLERRAQLGEAGAATALARARGRRSAGGRIERAHSHLSGGDGQAALAALLACWADTPATELAAAIERVSDVLASERGLVSGRTAGAVLLECNRLLREGDPLDRPRAIRAWEQLRCADARALLPLVGQGPRDPRVSAALLGLCRRTPMGWAGRKQVPFWRELLRELQRHADPRAMEALGTPLDGLFYLREAEITAVRAEIGPAPRLTSEDTAALVALLASLEPQRDHELEALWSAVYADLESDTPRSALAAALDARDDPRGEFFRSQLKRAAKGASGLSRREAQLVRTFRDSWLGSLSQLLARGGSVEWERGLPVALFASEAPTEPLKAREVRALKRIGLGRGLAGQGLLDALPCCPQRVSGLSLEQLEAGIPATVVDLRGVVAEASALERLGACARACPRLSALSFSAKAADPARPGGFTTEDLRRFLASPLGLRLEHLWLVNGSYLSLGAWGASLPASGEGTLLTLRVTGARSSDGSWERELIYHRGSVTTSWQLLMLRPPRRTRQGLDLAALVGRVELIVVDGASNRESLEQLFAAAHAPPRVYR